MHSPNLLSIYCFYKNEIEAFGVTVPTWLPFLEGGGELVLVDTGSSDRSAEWAHALAASPQVAAAGIRVKLADLPWPAPLNWAAITKQTMDLCSSPWRMRLDADEKLAGDPAALASVLRNLEQLAVDQDHAARDGLLTPGTIPVALGGLCLNITEAATGCDQFRSRLHRADWSWRYRIDPVPVPPPGQEGGVFMMLQPWICRVVHTRTSVRPDSLARAEGVLDLAERLDGPLDRLAQAHYQNAIDRARLYTPADPTEPADLSPLHINRMRFPTKTILVLEDDIAWQAKILGHLEKLFGAQGDVQVIVMPGGQDALAHFGGHGDWTESPWPKLILLDHDMPWGMGPAFLKVLKQDYVDFAKVLATSGLPHNNLRLLQLGADRAVQKGELLTGTADEWIKEVMASCGS